MKKFSFIQLIAVLLSVGTAIFLVSCSKDEPEPTAAFSFEVNELEVTFTNSSVKATSYSWDFGDGETSAETSPIHTYAKGGDYTVTLTAKGAGGEDEESKVVSLAEVSKVKIDGDFSDWDGITAKVTIDDDAEKTALKEMKVYDNGLYIYIYLKMAAGSESGVLDMMLDADYSSSTGYFSWMWGNAGIDYLIEGAIFTDKDAPMYQYTGVNCAEDWSWEEIVPVGSGLLTVADYKTTGDYTESEFSIVKEMIPGLSSEGIGIGLNLMDTDWSTIGAMPTSGKNYTMAKYKFADQSLSVDTVKE